MRVDGGSGLGWEESFRRSAWVLFRGVLFGKVEFGATRGSHVIQLGARNPNLRESG